MSLACGTDIISINAHFKYFAKFVASLPTFLPAMQQCDGLILVSKIIT